jgi:hypothetical protein
LGHCRNTAAGWFAAEIDSISLASSARSTDLGVATENIEIDRNRRRAADLGTRQV